MAASANARSDSDQQEARKDALETASAGNTAEVHQFKGEWDDEGVFFYQAFNDEISDYAIQHGRFGGPHFNPTRMTWIKPSFAWVLYRAGYGRKHNQSRILKVKLPHAAVAALLGACACKHGGGGHKGRVQWDPARDLLSSEDKGRQPRKMRRERAIQIGLSHELSEAYVGSVISIEDVTELAHAVGEAHATKPCQEGRQDAMAELLPRLPVERPYMPQCEHEALVRLQLVAAGSAAEASEGRS